MSAHVRSVQRGCDFQCVDGKVSPFYVVMVMVIVAVFFWVIQQKIGIDRSSADIDYLLIRAVEFPNVNIITSEMQ